MAAGGRVDGRLGMRMWIGAVRIVRQDHAKRKENFFHTPRELMTMIFRPSPPEQLKVVQINGC
jgi:hypothetical protein